MSFDETGDDCGPWGHTRGCSHSTPVLAASVLDGVDEVRRMVEQLDDRLHVTVMETDEATSDG